MLETLPTWSLAIDARIFRKTARIFRKTERIYRKPQTDSCTENMTKKIRFKLWIYTLFRLRKKIRWGKCQKWGFSLGGPRAGSHYGWRILEIRFTCTCTYFQNQKYVFRPFKIRPFFPKIRPPPLKIRVVETSLADLNSAPPDLDSKTKPILTLLQNHCFEGDAHSRGFSWGLVACLKDWPRSHKNLAPVDGIPGNGYNI